MGVYRTVAWCTPTTTSRQNLLVGILHGCLGGRAAYDKATAWKREEKWRQPLEGSTRLGEKGPYGGSVRLFPVGAVTAAMSSEFGPIDT